MRRGLILAGCLFVWVGVAAAGSAQKGKDLYMKRCSFCHGQTGKGDGPAGVALQPAPANFASASFWKANTEQQMVDTIKNGKAGTAMVAFGTSLSSADIDDLMAFLKTLAPE